MTRDWLLVEMLGNRPEVVAQGREVRRFVPLQAFLRRNPRRERVTAAVQAAFHVKEAARVRVSDDRPWAIITHPVCMSDGRVHGIQVWTGPAQIEPPERPRIGAIKWNLTTGAAFDTSAALLNSGMDADREPTDWRTFADDLASSELHDIDAAALALTVRTAPGRTFCSTWDGRDYQNRPIRVSFCARTNLESCGEGAPHLISRAMNWRATPVPAPSSRLNLTRQILHGTKQDGVHRALVDLDRGRLLKWIDDPCPHFDWRGVISDRPLVHPEDAHQLTSLATRLATQSTDAVLRLRTVTGWTPMHIRAFRIELDTGVYAAVVSMRLDAESNRAVDYHF
ncbi:MAG: DUF5628 domain-containing protein [Mycobacterium kyogaense]|uniref:PAS domain-containing protein n=1 Tax=Mycobacterium kyogaense TaxID=2212479 RepID=UPI002FF511F1